MMQNPANETRISERQGLIFQVVFLAFWFFLSLVMSQLFLGLLVGLFGVSPTSGWAIIFSAAVMQATLFGGICISFLKPFRHPPCRTRAEIFKSLGLDHPETITFIWIAVLATICSLGFVMITEIFPPEKPTPIEQLMQTKLDVLWISILALGFAPLVEESLFRGVLFPFGEKLMGKRSAIIVVSAMFAALHISQLWGYWLGISLIFLLGIFLTLVRARTGSTTLAWWFHFIYNFVWAVYAWMEV